jgi:ribonuclease HI
MGAEHKILVHTDGGARGNPGPAALGVTLEGEPIGVKGYGEYLGVKTNNEAEYEAVVYALKKIKQLIGRAVVKKTRVEVHADSELVVKQLNGEYKIENEKLQPLWLKIWNEKLEFASVTFRHIPREQNAAADKFVNEALDAATKKSGSLF